MRTSTEILHHTKDLMGRMYRQPEKFARTASELNVALNQIHHIWGYITGREAEMTEIHTDLCRSDYADGLPDGFFDVLDTSDSVALTLVSKHWRNVDAKLGITVE